MAQADSQQSGQYCQLCGGWRGCLGLEPTPEMFVGHIVLVARELWRVLRDDGTFWLNFGDSYASGGTSGLGEHKSKSGLNHGTGVVLGQSGNDMQARAAVPPALKPKDLIGIPWRVAFALQADGWYLRSDIIWAKGVSFCPTYSGSCMPESVRDRPTKGHEYVFLLSKNKRYFYDGDAVREAGAPTREWQEDTRGKGDDWRANGGAASRAAGGPTGFGTGSGRNLRTVWTINPGSYAGAHFATFPPALVEPMIKAGTSAKGCCPECGSPWVRVTEKSGAIKNADYETEQRSAMQQGGKASTTLNGTPAQTTTTGWRPTCSCEAPEEGFVVYEGVGDEQKRYLAPVPCTVLDPFAGTFTTGQEAIKLGRRAVGIELSKSYCDDHIIPRLSKGIQMELL